MESIGVEYELIEGTGIIATIKGKENGINRLIRADIDALEAKEDEKNLSNKKISVSKNDGAAHLCGHDAHMAVLLGTVKILSNHKNDLKGDVYCCFEEGEEYNCGIDAMMKALEKYHVDECFALHVYNQLDAGKINVVEGPRMAGCLGLGMFIEGKSGHASRPDQAINPIIPAAHIITQLNSAFMNQLNVEETVTLGFGKIDGGTATNAIPDQVYLGGTVRFFDQNEGEKAYEIVNKISETTAKNFNCDIKFESRHNITPKAVVNDPNVSKKIQNSITKLCGDTVLEDCEKWFASECYSAYLDRYPGALGFLGIKNEELGTGAAHHNKKFDIDESALKLGVLSQLAFVFSE